MSLSRKDFLWRSGSLALPFSIAGFSLGAETMGGSSALEYFNIRKFGARGDGQAKETKAIQAAMDEGVESWTLWNARCSYTLEAIRTPIVATSSSHTVVNLSTDSKITPITH